MTMQDIGIEIEEGQNLHDAAAEERKAFPVVVIAVASGTFEIIFIVHKIELYVVLLILKNAAVLIAPRQRNKNVSDELEILTVFLFDILIERNNDANVKIFILRDRFG